MSSFDFNTTDYNSKDGLHTRHWHLKVLKCIQSTL